MITMCAGDRCYNFYVTLGRLSGPKRVTLFHIISLPSPLQFSLLYKLASVFADKKKAPSFHFGICPSCRSSSGFTPMRVPVTCNRPLFCLSAVLRKIFLKLIVIPQRHTVCDVKDVIVLYTPE